MWGSYNKVRQLLTFNTVQVRVMLEQKPPVSCHRNKWLHFNLKLYRHTKQRSKFPASYDALTLSVCLSSCLCGSRYFVLFLRRVSEFSRHFDKSQAEKVAFLQQSRKSPFLSTADPGDVSFRGASVLIGPTTVVMWGMTCGINLMISHYCKFCNEYVTSVLM